MTEVNDYPAEDDCSAEVLVYPLSFGQERIWFMDRMAPGSPQFNLHNAYRLRSGVDYPALEEAVNAVVRRHETLRTSFRLLNDEPVQVVAPKLHLPLEISDIGDLSDAERKAALDALICNDAARPFDLTQAPLIRVRIVRVGDRDHVLSLTIHHIVSDGWSLGVFLSELFEAWRASASGRPAGNLPELAVQYGDYAVWQRQSLGSKGAQRQLEYWREQLRGLPDLDLPTDHPRPAVQSDEGRVHPLELSPELTRRVDDLSRRLGVTRFMTLVAVFEVLMHRYSRQRDFAVGSYIAGRNRTELEPMIGFFLNTLVLRAQLDGSLSFRTILDQVRNTTLDAYANQDLPFAKLVSELGRVRDPSRNPLVQVIFQIINVPTLNEGDDERATVVEVDKGTSLFDLTWTLWQSGAGMRGNVEFRTELFDSGTVKRMVAHFQTLLEGVLAEPDAPVGTLALLPHDERHLVVNGWNATDVPDDDPNGLAELWATQVDERPDAPAFVCDGAILTYRELDRRAEALVGRLHDLGVAQQSLVGVCLERGLQLPIALMAIVKLGGAFLPLDPSYPRNRLEFMIADSKTRTVITAADLRERVELSGVENLLVLGHGDTTAGSVARTNVPRVSPDALAYVIYTSGSTGRPKGVAVPVRQILNRLRWMWRAYPFTEGEVACQKTAFSFVDAIWELLGPLLQGVPTVIISDDVLRDPEAMTTALATHHVSRIWLVPSFLRALLDAAPNLEDRLADLRFWVTTGEPLPLELFERFRQAAPHATIYNLYGTSEVWDATWWDPNRERPPGHNVPIGRPLDNVKAYVLDDLDQPVPIGVAGELHIAGAGVAIGYLGLDDLTRARFVADPFDTDGRSLMYRTGDLARYQPDGCLEYLGRKDHQVKIRGFRVEPGEVESVLLRHAKVRTAAVTAVETLDDLKLHAYVSLYPGAPPTPEELRRYLRDRLPSYMVPAQLFVLDQLPTTPSGKIDRTALTTPADRPSQSTTPTAPDHGLSELEQSVATVWREVLQREHIGLHDNFFDLGGHSLLLFQVSTRLRRDLGREVRLNDLFRHPTIEATAGFLANGESVRSDTGRSRRRRTVRARRAEVTETRA